jgi:hypothetical protein
LHAHGSCVDRILLLFDELGRGVLINPFELGEGLLYLSVLLSIGVDVYCEAEVTCPVRLRGGVRLGAVAAPTAAAAGVGATRHWLSEVDGWALTAVQCMCLVRGVRPRV